MANLLSANHLSTRTALASNTHDHPLQLAVRGKVCRCLYHRLSTQLSLMERSEIMRSRVVKLQFIIDWKRPRRLRICPHEVGRASVEFFDGSTQ